MSEKNKKIILVEDDPMIIDIYSTILKKAGFDLETISSGQQALQRIKNSGPDQPAPDLILLDMILPDVSGIEILEQIRSTPATKHTTVFILTNQRDPLSQFTGGSKPDKILIKADTPPTQILEIIKEQFS